MAAVHSHSGDASGRSLPRASSDCGHRHRPGDGLHEGSVDAPSPLCGLDGGPLTRFSVAMPEELLMRFDGLVARRGVAKNRSELVRDLVREALIREEADQPGAEVMGTLTIVYGHHSGDVQETLHRIQHAHFGMIVSTTHVHLDEHSCLEVIILRGEATEVRIIADQILGTKGVKNGGLVITTTGQMI